jgi:MFS family permease
MSHERAGVLPRTSEFPGQVRFVGGGFIGMFVSMPAIVIYSLSALIPALQAEFGWSRAEIAFAYTIANLTLLVGSAFAGHAADRYGARLVGTLALTAFGLAVLALPLFVHNITTFYLAYFLLSLGGVGATSVVLLRPVLERFDRQRGIACGIANSGAGLAAFTLPQLTVLCLTTGAWQAPYLALGLLVLLSVPIILYLWRPEAGLRDREARAAIAEAYGPSLREVLHTRQFIIMSLVCLGAGAATTGLLVHLVPLFTDLGGTLESAAALASLLGLAAAIGRFGAGFALDWWRSPLVGLLLFGSATVGLVLLRAFDAEFAVIAMLLCGLVIGAESDLFAYFCTRYFGTRSLGAIYGWMYGMISLGGAFGPFGMGLMRDRLGDYDLALGLLAGTFGLMALAMFGLGRFRYDLQQA